MMNHCPNCGKTNLKPEGSVFIEAGPFDGRGYADEGDYDRYRCTDCNFVFGVMPEPQMRWQKPLWEVDSDVPMPNVQI